MTITLHCPAPSPSIPSYFFSTLLFCRRGRPQLILDRRPPHPQQREQQHQQQQARPPNPKAVPARDRLHGHHHRRALGPPSHPPRPQVPVPSISI